MEFLHGPPAPPGGAGHDSSAGHGRRDGGQKTRRSRGDALTLAERRQRRHPRFASRINLAAASCRQRRFSSGKRMGRKSSRTRSRCGRGSPSRSPDFGKIGRTRRRRTGCAHSRSSQRNRTSSSQLHDRLPVILAPESYERWLGREPDPADLIRPYPAEEMITWPVSVRVNTPKNDDPAILDQVEDALGTATSSTADMIVQSS